MSSPDRLSPDSSPDKRAYYSSPDNYGNLETSYESAFESPFLDPASPGLTPLRPYHANLSESLRLKRRRLFAEESSADRSPGSVSLSLVKNHEELEDLGALQEHEGLPSDCNTDSLLFLPEDTEEVDLIHKVKDSELVPGAGIEADSDLSLHEDSESNVSCASDFSESKDHFCSYSVPQDYKSSGSEIHSDSDSESELALSDVDQSEMLFEHSSITVEKAVLGLCEVYINARLSKKALTDILKYTDSVLPQPNLMPKTLATFFSFIKSFGSHVDEKMHLYCDVCLTAKSKVSDLCETPNCDGRKANAYFEFPLDEQIKFLFEKRGLATIIDNFMSNRLTEDGIFTDIVDGTEIRNLKKIFSGRYDITLIWNTDGISLSGSSTMHMWPILFSICEIPPRLRPYFICVNSVWYDCKEPCMDTYLKPFIDSLIKIHANGGVTWTHPISGDKIKSQVIAPCVVADAPARAMLQNVKRFNGKNGCNTCEVECSEVIVNDKKMNYYVFKETEAKLRTDGRMKRQAELAKDTEKKSVKGFKGVSPAALIPHLDVSRFVFPEYMHAVLLGVVRTFTSLILNLTIDGNFKFSRYLKDINQLLLSINVPDFITRLPRSLQALKMFKAHELRAWLLYYSLPILSQFLPGKYLQHWILLVSSIYLLLQERVSTKQLEMAEIMLRIFVRDVGKLYSNAAYKYNTHQLLHLCLTVRRWGPLFANSAFMFENYNGIISRMIHGTKNKGKELVENVKISTGILALKYSLNDCNESWDNNYENDSSVLGKEIEMSFSESQLHAIAKTKCAPYKVFLRAKRGQTVYSCKLYDSNVKRNNSHVAFRFGDRCNKLGQIVCFLQSVSSGEIFCLVDILRVDNVRFFVHKETRFQVEHIIPVKELSNECVIVHIANLEGKLIRVLNYLCLRPNSVEVIM